MKPKTQIEYRPLSELHELPGNPRTIKKDQFEKLKTSIQNNADYFEARPLILSDRTGELVILAGNQRYKAAKALKMAEVPTVTLHGLTEEREREIIIRDNVNNGEWDVDLLANEWNPEELIDWGVDIPDIKNEIEIIEDDPPAVNEKEPAKSKLGEIYQLGDHRLMVGDSTDPEQVAQLMGGETADLLITDPPYNVAYGQEGTVHHQRGKDREIMNDKFDDNAHFQMFLEDAFTAADQVMKPGAAWYIFHADLNGLPFRSAIEAVDWALREVIIWVKNTFTLGRQDYQWQHEPCLYGWKPGAAHYFVDVRTNSTVIDDQRELEELSKRELEELVLQYRNVLPQTVIREDKPLRSEEHPTMKPVKLISRLVGNSSRERERVLDIFGGSGTTMIACEQLGRSCYMMELDPHYADVIIERWEKFTGEKAQKIKEAE